MEFIPVSAHICELRKLLTCFLNFVKEFVRVVWVDLGYIKPDFLKVVTNSSSRGVSEMFMVLSSFKRKVLTGRRVNSKVAGPFFPLPRVILLLQITLI